jgi:hypothetical protein
MEEVEGVELLVVVGSGITPVHMLGSRKGISDANML